ncbi:MAG: succinate dehydrogenase [Demequina sp.]|jgi:succinate dehydrogenase / fumarate reductase membrane anchor subunit|nr:succinate dehydrogenase [Demequina sp.]
MASVAPELTPIPSRRTIGNVQRWAWMFQRISGLILIVLIFTHLIFNLVLGDGVSQIDFGFVAGKWAAPLWRWWDFALLVLALAHGYNGMRMIVDDYAHGRVWPKVLHWSLRLSVLALVILGTLVIFTFDPCPAGVDPSLIPSFCADL